MPWGSGDTIRAYREEANELRVVLKPLRNLYDAVRVWKSAHTAYRRAANKDGADSPTAQRKNIAMRDSKKRVNMMFNQARKALAAFDAWESESAQDDD